VAKLSPRSLFHERAKVLQQRGASGRKRPVAVTTTAAPASATPRGRIAILTSAIPQLTEREDFRHSKHCKIDFLTSEHHPAYLRMASVFEPSLSTSRALGPSPADSLPSINFGFDDLRDRMAKFTAKFDAFIEQGRKRVLEERNQFRISVAEVQGQFRSLFSSCDACAHDSN
jgi:hypothetical protein